MRKGIRLAAAALAIAVSGCDSIGDGASLVRVEVVKTSGVLGVSDTRVFQCFREGLQLLGYFSDGTIGNFTSRARWTSSRPNVLQVSNGDIPVPGSEDLVFSQGTLVPVASTDTPVTIRADFVGLSDEFVVASVEDVDSFSLTPAVQNIAVGTVHPLQLSATFAGVPVFVTGGASWTIDPLTAPDEDVEDTALVGNGTLAGVVSGVAANVRPLTVRAELSCAEGTASAALAEDLTASVTVATPTEIEITREFAPGTSIVIGTSEMLKTEAIFASGPRQDVSTQVTYTSSAPERLVGGLGGVSSGRHIFFTPGTATEGTATITAKLGTEDTSPTDEVTIGVIQASLVDIEIRNPEPIKVNPLQFVQLHADGTFSREGEPDFQQQITRHVTWSVGDATKLFVSNAAPSAGRLISLEAVAGESTVKAESGAASGVDEDTKAVEVCSGPLDVPCP